MSTTVPSWDEFINHHLLKSGVTSGVVLMSQLGTVSYRYGDLTNVPQEELRQFVNLFERRPECDHPVSVHPESDHPVSDHDSAAEPGFVLKLSGRQIHFKVFKRTYCSIYCTSKGDNSGLVICNLPYGILVCTYHRPVHTVQATTAIEAFCDRLRA